MTGPECSGELDDWKSARGRTCCLGVGASSSRDGEVGVECREREGGKVARMVGTVVGDDEWGSVAVVVVVVDAVVVVGELE
jgi:hypothetical protein